MSFRAVLWALKSELPPIRKLLLVALASHANTETNCCFPKVKTIAREASVSPRTVHRHLPELERLGFVTIEKKYRGKGRQPSNYRLHCALRDKPYDSGVRTPTASSGTYKRNHYSNHKNRAQQEAENALAKMLGQNGWEILTTCSEMVPLLIGKYLRGTLKESDLLDLRARFTMKGGQL